MNQSIKEISIGYWLDEKYVGKGIMTKACIEFINYAFDVYKLNRVEIRCAEDNLKSRAIPERLGFTKEGIIRDGELLNDGYTNCIIYGLLRREWNY
jgi:ribosomal-protein-serine acetyltransferase